MRENVFKRSFFERVTVGPDGCWTWEGTTITNRSGTRYGRIKRAGKNHLAHRYAFAKAFGDIPPGLVVRHRCDNSLCVNPAHLEVGTHGQNARDREARGRGNHPSGSDHYKSTLSPRQIQAIRRLKGEIPVRKLAAQYGVAHNTIVQIQTEERWTK